MSVNVLILLPLVAKRRRLVNTERPFTPAKVFELILADWTSAQTEGEQGKHTNKNNKLLHLSHSKLILSSLLQSRQRFVMGLNKMSFNIHISLLGTMTYKIRFLSNILEC